MSHSRRPTRLCRVLNGVRPSEPWQREVERQKRSNANALHYHELFVGHRRHLTDLVLAQLAGSSTAQASPPRLCVLGAGNCCDLDLRELARSYGSIDLVDVDAQALERAAARQDEHTRARLVQHAPVDLSGLLESAARWRELRVTLDEVLQQPALASKRIADAVEPPYDVVLSACVLSQLHFAARNLFSDEHPLFGAVMHTLTLTHLKTLARLCAPGGVALLVSDVATSEMAPLRDAGEHTDLRALLARQLGTGDVFTAVRPDTIVNIWRDDPALGRELGRPQLADVWIWQNGPRQSLLVYALAFLRQVF